MFSIPIQFSNFRSSRRNSTRADLSLGRWPATNTCLFSGRTAYTVPSFALRRAGLPSCASQPKHDGHQLPCGGPLPEHETTTLNPFASKQTTGYAAFGSLRGITLSVRWCCSIPLLILYIYQVYFEVFSNVILCLLPARQSNLEHDLKS